MLVNVLPDLQSPLLYLFISSYTDAGDARSPGRRDQRRRHHARVQAGPAHPGSTRPSSVEFPTNPPHRTKSGLKTIEIPSPPSDLLGVSTGGYFYLLAYTDTNLYTLQIVDPSGRVRAQRRVVIEDSELTFRDIHLSSTGIIYGLLADKSNGPRVLVAFGPPPERGMSVKIVSSEAMARIDSRTQAEFAFPSMLLMEDAGVKAWAILRRLAWGGTAAPRADRLHRRQGQQRGGRLRHGAAGRGGELRSPSSIVLAGGRPEKDSDPGRNLAACEALGIEIIDWPVQHGPGDHAASPRPPGSSTASRERASAAPCGRRSRTSCTCVNQAPGRKAALDVPSGVGDGYRPRALPPSAPT